ncbi:MAG TPA: TolC family protein [Gemmatimonadaceae bacterium]
MRIVSRRHVRRAFRHTLATLLGGVLPIMATAQQAPVASIASPLARLADVYGAVLRNNPRVAGAQALVRAAEARVPGAKRPPDPQLQLGFMNYTLPGLAPMEPLGMTQLQLMQMVPLGGKLALAGRAASAQAAATGERARDVTWELRTRTAMAFYDLWAAERQLAVTRETLRLLQDIARTTESMYRVGQGRQADVLRAQVEIARMAEDTVRMQAMRQTMVARLDALLNSEGVVVAPVLPEFPDSLPARFWLDSVAAAGRPMIRAGVDEVRAADARARRARRELIPDITVGIQYGRAPTTMQTVGADGMPATERKVENMGSLMIGASIPIFARDRQLQMRTETSAMQAMAQADVASMRAETQGQVGEAYASLVRARNLVRLYHTTVLPQAEATVASALSAYRVGQVDFMTLLDNRMNVNKYREELAQLEADEGKAWAELEMLTGRELLEAEP